MARRAGELGAVMGYGDEIIGSGLARGAARRGKRIAFGDGKRIIWSRQASEIYLYNPNVAPPGSEHRATDLEWIEYYKGRRLYAHVEGGRWLFHDFQCKPGEIYFGADEIERIAQWRWPLTEFKGRPVGPIIIEPNVKPHGACAGANKQWPVDRYLSVASELVNEGYWVARMGPGGNSEHAELRRIPTVSFREALMVMSQAQLYIGPEGGLHHAAAALGVPAVVIFGGFNTPRSTGYPWHVNITVGEPCGNTQACPHCIEAMKSIGIDRVLAAAHAQLATERQKVM
jgi:ADP-heptose:LPS heptosyltransferase